MFMMITMNMVMMMIIILVTFYYHLTEANIPPMFDSMGQLHRLLHLFVKDIITIVIIINNIIVVFVVIINIIIVLITAKRSLMLQ